MERIRFTQWLVALLLASAAHTSVWLGLNRQNTDFSYHPLQTIEVSLLPALPPVKTIAPPPAKPRIQPVPRVETPSPLENVVSEPVTEAAPVAAEQSNELPVPELQIPRFNAAYLNNPAPVYPAAARRRNIEGKVLVRAEVQADGRCSRVELKTPSDSELLNQAALDAVKKWRFVPATLGGQTVTAWVEVPITFKLEN